jgi:hypothetical protein
VSDASRKETVSEEGGEGGEEGRKKVLPPKRRRTVGPCRAWAGHWRRTTCWAVL